jgi:hypothetical protein
MKWLQDNPVGMVLASISGFFVLLALAMTVVWNLPVSVETAGTDKALATADETNLAMRPIGDLGEYQVINEKPVFNESRLPDIAAPEEDTQVDDTEIAIKDAPAVKLTGVVITPDSRFASLTPEDKKIENVMAREGESLTGEFVGWRVAEVNPRLVVLESRDGQSLKLELQVHDMKIEEPPPVAPASQAAQALATGGADEAEDGEPMSRAEQIRQRIAERREELRREQEAQQSEAGAQADAASQPAQPPSYQSAIRALMNKKSKDQGSNDKEDG